MKLRQGWISNSSSTSFVVSLSSFSLEDRDRIEQLPDQSDDLSRCTGIISDIDGWLRQFGDGEDRFYLDGALRGMMERYPDLAIIRESDEGMCGYLGEDYGLDCVDDHAMFSFDYH
jgi:hypothetical protein